MSKNYSSKKYTTRIRPITQTQIEKLRASKLAQAKTKAEKRFIKSQKFDSTLRANIRTNRANTNRMKIEKIISGRSLSREQQQTFREILGTKTSIGKNGRPIRKYTMTSLAQTKRLQRVEKQIAKNKFNIKRYVQSSSKFKEIKQYLPEQATLGDYLQALNRNEFYYENKKTILQHNKNVQKHGVDQASQMSSGKKLKQKYFAQLNDETQDLLKSMGVE